MDNIISKISVDDVIYEISTMQSDDATAYPSDILFGKTAYARGNKIEGTIFIQGDLTITPSKDQQTIKSGKYLSKDIIITGDQNLIPENIVSGKTIFNIIGNGGGSYIYSATNSGSYTNFPAKTGNNRNDASNSMNNTEPGNKFGYGAPFGFRSSIVCPFDCKITFTATSGTSVYKNNSGIGSGTQINKGDVLGVEKSESNSSSGGHGAFIILTPIE